MATQGPSPAQTAASADFFGFTEWTNPSNAADNNTGTYAVATYMAGSGGSDLLKLTNFGFTVPTNCKIKGLAVAYLRRASGADVNDYWVRLYDNTTFIGDDKARTSEDWVTTAGGKWTADYGGESDGWNASLTPTIINSSTFGVWLVCKNFAAFPRTAYVYEIRATVYYVPPVRPWSVRRQRRYMGVR